MSGSKVNFYSTTYTSITNMQQTLDVTRYGYIALNLTNMSTTAMPAISAGSKVEIDGSLYQFSSEEAISTTSIVSTESNINNYIILVPSSSQVTAYFSTVVPTWIDSKQGWYYGSTSNQRYVGVTLQKSGSYVFKKIFDYNFKDSCIYLKSTTQSWGSPGVANFPFDYKIQDDFNQWSTTNFIFSPIRSGNYNVSFFSNLSINYCYPYISINSSITSTISDLNTRCGYGRVWADPLGGGDKEYLISRTNTIFLSTADNLYVTFYSDSSFTARGYSTTSTANFIFGPGSGITINRL